MTGRKEKRPLGRAIAVFALLPVIVGLERSTYWSARSTLPRHLAVTLGASSENLTALLSVQTGVLALALLAGGGLALAAGPPVTLAVGAVLCIAGYGVLAASPGVAGAWAGLLVLALGQGLFRPSAVALAAAEFPHPRAHVRAAALVALHAVTSVATLVSSPTASALAQRAGTRAVLVSSAAVAAVTALLAAAFAVTLHWLRPKDDAPGSRGPAPRMVALGTLALVALLVPYHLLVSIQSAAAMDGALGISRVGRAAIAGLHPLAAVVTALGALAGLAVFHWLGLRSFRLQTIAVGTAIAAVGVLPLLLGRGSLVAAGGSEVILGIADVLVTPFALSRLAGDLPPRTATLAVAAFQCVTLLLGFAGRTLHQALPASGPLMVGIVALLVLGVAVAMLAMTVPLERALFARESAPGNR